MGGLRRASPLAGAWAAGLTGAASSTALFHPSWRPTGHGCSIVDAGGCVGVIVQRALFKYNAGS